MHTGITDLSNTVLNQLRKACAAAAASGGGGAGGAGGSSALLSRDSHDGGLDLDSIYGGDSGPSIGSLMEVLHCTAALLCTVAFVRHCRILLYAKSS